MRTLKLTGWHLAIWLGLAACAAAMAVWSCLSYNEVAGTDKTPRHIAVIAVAVVTGPMVGPVANPGATGIRDFTVGLAWILAGGVVAALVPFVLVKRPVSNWWFGLAWGGFVVASVAWFFAGLVSLGIHLS